MKLKVTLKRSVIGSTQKQRNTVVGLGLRNINQSKVLEKWNSTVPKPFRENSLFRFYKLLNILADDVIKVNH